MGNWFIGDEGGGHGILLRFVEGFIVTISKAISWGAVVAHEAGLDVAKAELGGGAKTEL